MPVCVLDNWALIHAQQLALEEKLPLHVCFCLFVPKSELSTLRHYSFMLKGLEEVAQVLAEWSFERTDLLMASALSSVICDSGTPLRGLTLISCSHQTGM